MAENFRSGVSSTYVTYESNIRHDFKIRYSSNFVAGDPGRSNYDPSVVVEFIVKDEVCSIYLSVEDYNQLFRAAQTIDTLLTNTANNNRTW